MESQAPITHPLSPPSSSSSPSHEFSFTISLHTSGKPPPPIATADEIFFHGHLLPLHLLSHLPVSPRTSINSLDSFTLPITELDPINKANEIKPDEDETKGSSNSNSNSNSNSKSKSFSLFGLPKWRKGCEEQGKKMKFDVGNVLKRYMRMVRPLLSFRGRRDSLNMRRREEGFSSFSGNLGFKTRPELRGRKGECSAPASMRTSPTNSGLLVASGSVPKSTSDSTMEELQAAIQAAIAHCKNSIAVDDTKSKSIAS